MKEVRKKSSDKLTEYMIRKASAQDVELNWDRYERQVPMCGFGRLGFCCDACTQGPCRIAPFDESNRKTVCGRDQEDMRSSAFLRLVSAGGAAQASFINKSTKNDYKLRGNSLQIPNWARNEKNKLKELELMPRSLPSEVFEAFTLSNEGGLRSEAACVSAIKIGLSGLFNLEDVFREKINRDIEMLYAGLRALKQNNANVLLHGNIVPESVTKLKNSDNDGKVNYVGMCGGELTGINPVGNYGSQESILLTNKVDTVIMGNQCISPGFKCLANKLGTPLFYDEDILKIAPEDIFQTAEEHYKERENQKSDAEFPLNEATVGFTSDIFREVSTETWKGLLQEHEIPGIALVSGCNNAKVTHDKDITKSTKQLLSKGFIVLATGCAAISLANRHLMNVSNGKEYTNIRGFLDDLGQEINMDSLPPVFNFGTCWETYEAVKLMKTLDTKLGSSFRKLAIFPEISRPLAWAAAISLPALGVKTYVGPAMPSGTSENILNSMNDLLGEELLKFIGYKETEVA